MHTMYIKSLVVLALIVAALWPSLPARAQEPSDVTVTTNVPVALLIRGIETKSLPASVGTEARVCVQSANHYISERERYRFEQWDYVATAGAAGDSNLAWPLSAPPSDPCIVTGVPGIYTARYTHEVLFQLRSEVEGFQRSWWTPRGQIVSLQVPEVVEQSETVRFRFKEWSLGESPFTATSQIVALQPIDLKVTWTPEYYTSVLNHDGNPTSLSGWYSRGDVMVLRADPQIQSENGRSRMTFDHWEVVLGPLPSVNDAESPSTAVLIDGPYVFRAVYKQTYLVEASNFQGNLLSGWYSDGDEVSLSTPTIVETVPERERFVFKHWKNGELLDESDSLHLVVDGPLSLEGVYEKQYHVNVVSPYGASGEGWYADGEKTIVMAPEEPQSMLFFKRKFDGFLGYGDERILGEEPLTAIEVDRPITITAVYRSEINTSVLGLMVGLLIAGITFYAGTEWGPSLYRVWRARRQANVGTPSEGGLVVEGIPQRRARFGIRRLLSLVRREQGSTPESEGS